MNWFSKQEKIVVGMKPNFSKFGLNGKLKAEMK